MPADRSNKASKAKAAAPAAAAPAAPAASKPSTSAAGSSKKDTKKPWSKRVQEAPQPLPKSLLSQKRKADGAAPAETQEEQETPILTGLDPSAYHSSSSEGEDSSDDDDDISDSGAIDAGIEVSKLPTIAKDDATVKRKLEKAKKSKDKAPGTLYLGRVPHGFYEKQLKAYFEQFGDVEKVRLARNKKTGKSKHYGFIQMAQLSVANIVAETMDNYLLLGHILRCKVLPSDEVHADMWVGANRKFRAVPAVRLERARLEKPRTADERDKADRRASKRQAAKKAKLSALGIDYDIDAPAIKAAPKAQQA